MSSKAQIHVPHGSSNGELTEVSLIVQGLAARKKITGGVATGTASVAVATGLTTIDGVALGVKADAAGEINASPSISYEVSGGTLTIYRWKHTGPSTATLVAATTAGSVGWTAVGS